MRAWKGLHALLLFCACVPAVTTATHVLSSLPNVPFWDQWQFTELLMLDREGRVGWANLWAPHNEHRMPIPKLVMLLLARASQWDVRWELAANLACAAATLCLLAHVIRRTVGAAAPVAAPWVVLGAAVLVFSPAQWEGLVWGFTLQIFLAQLAAAAFAVCVLHGRGRWGDVALQLVVAACGALSYGAGIALLGVVPVAALAGPRAGPRRRRVAQAAVAAVCAAALALAYVHGPGGQNSTALPEGAQQSREPFGFVFGWIGAGTGALDPEMALLLGAAGPVSFALLAAGLWRRERALRPLLAPWIALVLFVVGAASLTAAGRIGFGYEQALIPRYVTLSLLFWIAWLALAAMALARLSASAAVARPRLAATAALAGGILSIAASGQTESWRVGRAQVRQRRLLLEHGAALLENRERAPTAGFALLFHDPGAVRRWADELARLHLGPFAHDPAPPADLDSFELVRADAMAGNLEAEAPDPRSLGCRILRGWALDPFDRDAVDSVLVTAGRRVVGTARPTLERADVARVLGLPHTPRAGWEVHIPEFAVDETTLRVFARLKGNRIVRLGQMTLNPALTAER